MLNEFNVIDVMNESMIRMLKEKNKNYEKNLKIREYLKDEAIFFKIKKETAYLILKNVGVKEEQLETVYKKLISENVFYELLHKRKITEKDENLIIKYPIYRIRKFI